jgi:inhibitor of KinA sporulation pathway (predicted exonuclease)
MLWWMKQSEAARKEIVEASSDLDETLEEFTQWLPTDSKVWGNGADFDNVILSAAYQKVGQTLPWKFWNNRCFRTVRSLCNVPYKFEGTAHNALDDAKNQALHLIQIMDALKRGI